MAVADKVVDRVQSAFIKGRFILDDVVILHETMHEINRSKRTAVFLKVDFEKAYDKVNWTFLYQILGMKGFPDNYRDWVMHFVTSGSVGIIVNDTLGPFFRTHKGLRQGDPFSPLLFNLVADSLTILIKRAHEQGLVKGVVPELVSGGLSMLQYADDTIFLFDGDIEGARNLKFILSF